MFLNKGRKTEKEVLLEELAKEDLQVLALAYIYAKNLHMYVEDVTKAGCSAIQNVAMLDKAYQKGYYDAMNKKMIESDGAQPKQTDDSCLDFDFDKVKEILKKDSLDNLIVDHTCEEKQEQTRDEKMIDAIDFAIKATDSQDDYSMGMRNGMRYVKSLIDSKEPQYELRRTDEETKLGIDLGDEVVSDFGTKGVVVGIDTYKGMIMLSLLMRNHKVPQLVEASRYTKTGRHFDTIEKLYEKMKKGEADGK